MSKATAQIEHTSRTTALPLSLATRPVPALSPSATQPAAQPAAQPADAATAAAHRRHLAHDARNWLTVLRIHCDLLEQSGAVDEKYRGFLHELSTNIDRGQSIVAGLLAAETVAATTTPAVPSSTPTIVAASAHIAENRFETESGSGRKFTSPVNQETSQESSQETSQETPKSNQPAHDDNGNERQPEIQSGLVSLSPTHVQPIAANSLPVSERKPRTMFSTISMPVKQFPSPVPDRSGMLHLLVVDDETSIRTAAAEIARNRGFSVHTAENTAGARAALEAHMADIVLLDLRLPGGGGLALLDEIRTLYPETVVIVMTAYATVSSAVEAMRSGASEYLTKPFTLDELGEVLERGAERRHFDVESRRLREKLRTPEGFGTLIGRSPEMERMYRILAKVATTTHPVLILGESGTGKEMVARTIHYNGPHANQPFIPVDCGSLVPTLIESELFGYVKGAFTGANRSKDGLLATAEGGTVFLDEIGELPLDLQAKLLRALQEKEIRPVGSTQRIPIRARILAATNRDLPTMVEQGRFRKDLYFRLNVVNVKLPPLRDRRADIPILAAHFLDKLSRENEREYTLSDDVLRVMNSYDWPGNVRELENMIERACALSSGPLLHLGDLPTQLQEHRLQTQRLHQANQAAQESQAALDAEAHTGDESILTIAEMEKQAILNTIRQLNGDKLTAAKLLGIGKTTLYRKLKEYGISDIELQ